MSVDKVREKLVLAWATKNCCNWGFFLDKCGACMKAGTCSVAAELEREEAAWRNER